MNRADYTHQIMKVNEENAFIHHDVLLINDLDLGNTPVTNDIENVVADIAKLENVDPEKLIILYCDSDNLWNAWDHSKQIFIELIEETWEQAFKTFLQKQLNSHL